MGEAVGCSLGQVTELLGDGHHIVLGAFEPSDSAANDEPASVTRLRACKARAASRMASSSAPGAAAHFPVDGGGQRPQRERLTRRTGRPRVRERSRDGRGNAVTAIGVSEQDNDQGAMHLFALTLSPTP